jgi:hypothetical protein
LLPMSVDERLAALEKEVAELKKQVLVQPEEIAEKLALSLKNTFTKLTCQK